MISWTIIKYLYILSSLSMALFIVQNKDTLMMQNEFFKQNDPENSIGFELEMIIFIIFSPLVWASILAQKFHK